MLEAVVLSEQYRRKYSTYRPLSALDYQTPAVYALGSQAVEIGTTGLLPSPHFDNDPKAKEQKHKLVPALI